MKWKQRTAEELDPKLIDKYQLSPIAAKLFSLRGINTDEKLNFWFNATEDDLADPSLMHDMDKAVKRINQAIDKGEKITVYGDYDADGITSTTIMTETLSILGADVHYFIPSRFKDGYGPNLERYKQIVADGSKLIITVDNGVTGIDEVAYAKDKGVDTIVTDHHTIQDKLPDAYAIVHCNYPGQKYPFDDYCGAGIAYTICRSLMQDPMPELLDLAMIGTIGDMVKVSGEGHIIVKRGLEVLNQTDRPGLRALIKNAGLTMGSINETDIGFNIAPRLNAVGRLADANLAVELLLSDDDIEAQKLADQVEKLNEKRKKLTTKVYNACLKQVKKNSWQRKNTLVLYDPTFHEGVLGLVANKIVEKLHKPTVILTKNAAGEIKGSGRSIPGFNLFDALNPLKEKLLTKFGGHDFACGLSMTEDKIDALRDAFEKSFYVKGGLETKYYDMELPMKGLATSTIAEVNQAGPFGTDNAQPVFSISDPQIMDFHKIGKDKTHVKFNAVKSDGKLDIVGFNKAFLNNNLLPFVSKIFVQLSLNAYRNRISLQGIMEGVSFAAPKLAVPTKVIDMRSENYVMGFADRYLLFDPKNIAIVKNSLGIDEDKISLAKDYNANGETVVLLDAPHNQVELDHALENNYQQLYLRFLLDQLLVERIPDKSYFGKVLKYIYAHPTLKPEDYRTVAPYLGLNYDSILFILRVFFELGFVQLDNDKLVGKKNPEKKPLTASKYLLATQSQIKFVRELRNMPSQQLLAYVNNLIK
ncbi:single-stranded-DNA-specific exonuclease RecJ [Lactobacillus acetotolerans]|uniref:Single-stranded-DNA-specific exonuclease RecJ n=1 Tax=Lactobacillus acetotolerans TaxID=1600 RepID=A0A5P5ZIC9_9LACO|nr:single-stranded-DNA-specific exonuclease RecJ [Lactobacillus acetotolerans]KRN41524.1 single-stranded-DNA-specific exonuclease [Lactobacillus acetotolerans DSM 20749 = JCM 3825]QFG51169.1 single-stranded-DNA-specific exonuclease RecJ [Lactobacillus acetotolerans]QGV04724.1 single-stranded-DNA-specific exonuclease RecJ [Lactobacillus acetotolerans]GGV11959.1 single-stranded-DNA-specific exonuclease [Lactobacillus acetotolerans DSM 20749 = JCM 3825]